MSVCLCLCICLCLCLCVCVSLSLTLSLYLAYSFSISVIRPICGSLSILSAYLFLSIYMFLYVSVCLFFHLSDAHSSFLFLSVSLCISVSLCYSLCWEIDYGGGAGMGKERSLDELGRPASVCFLYRVTDELLTVARSVRESRPNHILASAQNNLPCTKTLSL